MSFQGRARIWTKISPSLAPQVRSLLRPQAALLPANSLRHGTEPQSRWRSQDGDQAKVKLPPHLRLEASNSRDRGRKGDGIGHVWSAEVYTSSQLQTGLARLMTRARPSETAGTRGTHKTVRDLITLTYCRSKS